MDGHLQDRFRYADGEPASDDCGFAGSGPVGPSRNRPVDGGVEMDGPVESSGVSPFDGIGSSGSVNSCTLSDMCCAAASAAHR